jgi:hypothetical protein
MYINLAETTPEEIVQKLKDMAANVVRPVYYRFQINGHDMDETDYKTITEAKDAAQGRWEQINDEDTPDDVSNGDELVEAVTLYKVSYDENEDLVIGDQFYSEVTWEYYHGDFAEHNTLWGI